MLKKTLDALGWAGTALVVGALATRFLKPDLQRIWTGLAYAGLACVLLYTLAQWRQAARIFSRRQAKYGTLAIASVLIVLGILIAINYLASRQNQRWDLTAAKQFSLSDQTRKVLANLKAPVNILVFDKEMEFGRFQDRLREYEYHSKLVKLEYVDADKKPARTRQYQVQSYGTVVLEYQGRTERVTSDTEQDLTNALIKVVTGRENKVYFTQGHGEKDTGSSERTGYSAIAQALGRENFKVEKLVLAQQPEVPADAAVVVVAGPQADFLRPEADALRRYLRRGGKALFLVDPPSRPDATLATLRGLLREWAIEVGDNVVVDVSGIGQLIGTDESVPVAASYPSHAITERFDLLSAYPFARSVSPVSGGVDGRFAQTFVETSPQSWAEADMEKLRKGGAVKLEEDKGDKKGPVSVAAAVSATASDATGAGGGDNSKDDGPKPETRVAVFGDSDFAANFILGIRGNTDLFLNTVNWLAQQENLIAIRPRDPEDRRVTLTADQQRRIFWLSVVIIPGAILASGVYTWWRRR